MALEEGRNVRSKLVTITLAVIFVIKILALNSKHNQLFKLTTGIITWLPEKEKSHQKNDIVYALHVSVD